MTHTVADVARTMEVSKTTVHRWSSWFAGHLSEQARGGTGKPRAFTEADIATLRRAQRRLAAGESWQAVNAQLAVITPEEEEPARDEARGAAQDEAHERAQSTAGQALLILDQQTRLIDAQAGQLADQRAQIADQAARLREQAAQIAGQAGVIATLSERLARVEEAQRLAERRRFRWPWEPRDEAPS